LEDDEFDVDGKIDEHGVVNEGNKQEVEDKDHKDFQINKTWMKVNSSLHHFFLINKHI